MDTENSRNIRVFQTERGFLNKGPSEEDTIPKYLGVTPFKEPRLKNWII